jgi:hypothetical protein
LRRNALFFNDFESVFVGAYAVGRRLAGAPAIDNRQELKEGVRTRIKRSYEFFGSSRPG